MLLKAYSFTLKPLDEADSLKVLYVKQGMATFDGHHSPFITGKLNKMAYLPEEGYAC